MLGFRSSHPKDAAPTCCELRPTGSAAATANAKQLAARAALVLLIAAGLLWSLVNRERFEVESLTDWIESFGLLAPLAFCAARVLGAVVMVPGSLMAIAAGVMFGVLWGAAYNLIASTAGAVLAFVLARYLFPDLIARCVAHHGRLRRLVEGVEEEGWRFVAFVRLVPLFPYNLLNYALGLTRIKLSHFTLASLCACCPETSPTSIWASRRARRWRAANAPFATASSR